MGYMITYKRLLSELAHLARVGVEVGSIGHSVDNRNLPYIFVGSRKGHSVLVTAGIHAREHIGCHVVMQQVYYALNHLKEVSALGGVYFVPMVNPDGNVIVQRGADGIENPRLRQFVAKILGQSDYRLYKANASGVDLNVNFDASWGTGKQNIRHPAPANYIGAMPFSEPETRALRAFTMKIGCAATVSYHAIGRELYWEFGQSEPQRSRDYALARHINQKLQYTLKDDDGTSAGGFKDYCIQKLKIPAFTIELVDECHPHPFCDYSLAREDVCRNVDLPLRLLTQSAVRCGLR